MTANGTRCFFVSFDEARVEARTTTEGITYPVLIVSGTAPANVTVQVTAAGLLGRPYMPGDPHPPDYHPYFVMGCAAGDTSTSTKPYTQVVSDLVQRPKGIEVYGANGTHRIDIDWNGINRHSWNRNPSNRTTTSSPSAAAVGEGN